MVAERLGCRTIEIDNWMMKDNPMEAVLHHAMRGDIKLGELLKVLQDIERLDVLQATARMIGKLRKFGNMNSFSDKPCLKSCVVLVNTISF